MNKRGQGLPLTTVIIAILVILVLVIVIFFFLGGMRGVSDKVKSIFSKTVSGTDIALAVQTCQTYCDQAKDLPENLRSSSAFCKISFYLDTDDSGEAELVDKTDKSKGYKKFFCDSPEINVDCGIKCPGADVEKLGP